MASRTTGVSRNVKVTKSLGHVLITGGTGFLGSNIAELLIEREACTKISALDLRSSKEPLDGVEYHFGDITDYSSMLEVFQKLKPTVVIHTASPHFNIPQKEIMYKVNVEGTKTIIRAAQETGVKALVYTSSASVISDNQTDLVNADEEYPLVIGDNQPLYYTTTKALAEMEALASNRPASHPEFLTCAIRPAGIFGAGDVQFLPPMLAAYYRGQTRFQLGNNENLFDVTNVVNIAHAHHLAAAALLTAVDEEAKGGSPPSDDDKVDGEAFFITNDSPVYFWDFTRTAWSIAGDTTKPKDVWVIPKDFGLTIASIIEWVMWGLRQGVPSLTREKVKFSCMTRYYNIDKAKRRLGYRPVVSLREGLEKGVHDAIRRGVIPGMPEELKEKIESKKEQ